MSSETPTGSRVTTEQTRQQLRKLVDEISLLAKRELQPDRYYAEFLRRVVEALAAVGGAVGAGESESIGGAAVGAVLGAIGGSAFEGIKIVADKVC